MTDLHLEPLAAAEFGHYEGWFNQEASDQMLASAGSIDSLLAGSPNSLVWKVVLVGETVALVIVSVDSSRVGYINMVVDPSARRHHVGSEAIRLLLGKPEIKKLAGLASEVDAGNTGAQKILVKNGFAKVGNTSDGKLEFRLVR